MEFANQSYGHHAMAGYKNAMDSDNGNYLSGDGEGSQGGRAPVDNLGLGVGDIGMSVPMGIAAANVSGVYSKIRMGAKAMEIGFPGAGGGQRQAQTPGMYGQDQRQALRELAAINEVNLTTHAAYNVMGLMGQDQQGNFSLTQARAARAEVERAIDFAADVSGGGSVVVHTGEFERPVTQIYPEFDPERGILGNVTDDQGRRARNYSRDPETGRLLFKKRQTEAGDYGYQLVDDRTGQVYTHVQGDRLVAQPVWLRAKEDYMGEDAEGNRVQIKKGDYIDYEKRKIPDPFDIRYEMKHVTDDPDTKSVGGRVPEYDGKTGRFKTHLMSVEDFEQDAMEYNQNFRKTMNRDPDYYERVSAREMFMRSTFLTNAGHSRGWALQYGEKIDKEMEKLEKLKQMKEFWGKLDPKIPEEEKWKIMRQDDFMKRFSDGLLPIETKHPLEMINKEIASTRKSLEFAQQASTSQELQAEDAIETLRHLRTPEKNMEKHTLKEYGMLGVRAFEKTKDPNNPLVMNLEHIFPEKFGGHPEELKTIIKGARRKMVEMLTEQYKQWTGGEGDWLEKTGEGPYKRRQTEPGPNPYYKPGLSREEATKLAERHIKATLDTGHLNLWRKYWVNDQKLTADQNEQAFKQWYLDQVESLAKEKMVGNVHLADNYGYQDDHLSPGEGNTPIRETAAILRKYGYDKAWTVEPGADASTDVSDFHGLMKTWRYFGSSVYGLGEGGGGGGGMGAPQQWGNIQQSYFGHNQPPYFVFGSYSPSNEWTLFSGVPLE